MTAVTALVTVTLEPIPADIGQRQGTTLDKSPVLCRVDIQGQTTTHINPVSLTCMPLACGRKPGYLQ